MYLNTHLGNTLLVNDTPYRIYLNPPFNAIFVESYEDLPKEDSYFMKIFLLYLELNLHYSRLNVPTFVKLYPFGAIKSLKENGVRSWMLFKKCTMACYAYFNRNCSISIVCSPNFFFCSFFPLFLGLSKFFHLCGPWFLGLCQLLIVFSFRWLVFCFLKRWKMWSRQIHTLLWSWFGWNSIDFEWWLPSALFAYSEGESISCDFRFEWTFDHHMFQEGRVWKRYILHHHSPS